MGRLIRPPGSWASLILFLLCPDSGAGTPPPEFLPPMDVRVQSQLRRTWKPAFLMNRNPSTLSSPLAVCPPFFGVTQRRCGAQLSRSRRETGSRGPLRECVPGPGGNVTHLIIRRCRGELTTFREAWPWQGPASPSQVAGGRTASHPLPRGSEGQPCSPCTPRRELRDLHPPAQGYARTPSFLTHSPGGRGPRRPHSTLPSGHVVNPRHGALSGGLCVSPVPGACLP